ncbi:protein translocase subunit SecDF [Bacillaceae bacterium S4-13-58]
MTKRGRIVAFFAIVFIAAVAIGMTVNGVAKDVRLGLDLQGGFEILYEVTPLDGEEEVNDKVLDATVQSLYERVDVLGISETDIEIEEPNRIRVQLAGIKDQAAARELLSTSAELTFRDIEDKKLLDGSDLVEGSAQQSYNQNNEVVVTVKLKSASKFADVTQEVLNRGRNYPNNALVIWLDYEEGDSFAEEFQKEDPKYISAPGVNEIIRSTDVEISGNFTMESAKQLADILNAGSLPVKLGELYSTSVSAQFGEQALFKTVTAGAIGVALILLFMLVYYRFLGVISVVTLSIYIYLILLVFNLMNGVLTLPGIAALILGIGMAVDANIITYERIKEELKSGKSTMAAFRTGMSRSLATILDANVTTILAAIVLFIFGTSSVKGFATLLIISIVLSFATAVYGTRLLLGLWVKSRFLNNRPGFFGVKKEQIVDIEKGEEVKPQVLGRQFNFVDHRKKFFVLSGILLSVGAIMLLTMGLNLGIDFTSGSRVEIGTNQTLTVDQLEKDFEEIGVNPKQILLSGDNNESGVARFDKQLQQDQVAEINSYFQDKYDATSNVGTVSPIVGQELAKNAVLAVLYASIGIIIYVTFRFEFFFAITAIIALLHDAFFILALFSITRLEFDITIIAAILTIVGYSINDTIVTFDRIRENLILEKRIKSFSHLASIVNKSLMQTLGRSINTVITTIFAAMMLLIFGASSITTFAFALVVGLVAGTYSSLFIAAQLWLVWRGKMLDRNPINFNKKKPTGGPQV